MVGDSKLGRKAKGGNESLFQIFLPEVIDLVLQQLTFQQVKLCRLVCTALNEEACRILKIKGILQLKPSEMKLYSTYRQNNLLGPFGSLVTGGDPKISIGISVGPNPEDISRFKEAFQDEPLDIIPAGSPLIPPSTLPAIPLTNFNIQLPRPHSSHKQQMEFEKDCQWLLKKYSSSLTHMFLFFRDSESHLSKFFAPNLTFPALEFLEIGRGISFNDELPEPQHVFDIAQILSVSPKLRTLKMNGPAQIQSLPDGSPFNFLSLKYLEIAGDPDLFEEIVALQPPLQLQLQSLVIHNIDNVELLPILSHFAPTLVKLKICEDDFFRKCPPEDVPHFPVLTHLFATEHTLDYGEPWLLKMPALKCLSVQRIRLVRVASEESLLNWQLNGPGPSVEIIRSEIVKLSKDMSERQRALRDFKTVFPQAKVWYLDTTVNIFMVELWQLDADAEDDNEIRSCTKHQFLPGQYVEESTLLFYWNNDACFDGRRWAKEASELPSWHKRKESEIFRHVQEQECNLTRFWCQQCNPHIYLTTVFVVMICAVLVGLIIR